MWRNKYKFQYIQNHNFPYNKNTSVLNVFYLIKSIENSIEFGIENSNRPFIGKKFCDNKHKLNLFINFFNKEIYDHIRDDKDNYRTLEPNNILSELEYHFSLPAYDTLKELLHFLNRTIVLIQKLESIEIHLEINQKNIQQNYYFPFLLSFVDDGNSFFRSIYTGFYWQLIISNKLELFINYFKEIGKGPDLMKLKYNEASYYEIILETLQSIQKYVLKKEPIFLYDCFMMHCLLNPYFDLGNILFFKMLVENFLLKNYNLTIRGSKIQDSVNLKDASKPQYYKNLSVYMGIEPTELIIEIVSIVLGIKIVIYSTLNFKESFKEYNYQLNDYQSEICRRVNYQNDNLCIVLVVTNEQYSLILNCKENCLNDKFDLSQKICFQIERLMRLESQTRINFRELCKKDEPDQNYSEAQINYSTDPPNDNIYTYLPWSKSAVKIQIKSYIEELIKFNKVENSGFIQSDFSNLTCPVLRKLIPIKDMCIVLEQSYGYLLKQLNEMKKQFISNGNRCEICEKMLSLNPHNRKESQSKIHKNCNYSLKRKTEAQKRIQESIDGNSKKNQYYYTSIYVLTEELSRKPTYKKKKFKSSKDSYVQPETNATIKLNRVNYSSGFSQFPTRMNKIIEENEDENKEDQFFTKPKDILDQSKQNLESRNTIKFYDAISLIEINNTQRQNLSNQEEEGKSKVDSEPVFIENSTKLDFSNFLKLQNRAIENDETINKDSLSGMNSNEEATNKLNAPYYQSLGMNSSTKISNQYFDPTPTRKLQF